MYGQFKICRKNGRYAKSSLPGSIYDTINLPLMNITLMNIIDTENLVNFFSEKITLLLEKNMVIENLIFLSKKLDTAG